MKPKNRTGIRGDRRSNSKVSVTAIQLFDPEPNTLYRLDSVSRLTHIPRREILLFHKHGLVPSIFDPELGFHFTDEAIQTLRFIQYLRTDCGVNLPGIKVILQLTTELERFMEPGEKAGTPVRF